MEEGHCDFVVAERELAIQEMVAEMDSGTHSESGRRLGEAQKRLFSDLVSLDQPQSLRQPEDPTHSDLGRNAVGLFQ